MARLKVAYQPIVDREQRPLPWFQEFIEEMTEVTNGLNGFIGSDGKLSADGLAQGLENRVTQIANKVIARNADGTIASITETDPETAATVRTKTYTYNADQTVSQAVEVIAEENTTTTSDFFYDVNGLIESVDYEVS